ncbi:immunoglobulin-like domain-containing protein [Vibrio atypicus]|uniref:immunoglobulin-like domain-containing protein n=1 Tax=Vibrio atypicus TaxID=558271 RepID=UPI0037367F1A
MNIRRCIKFVITLSMAFTLAACSPDDSNGGSATQVTTTSDIHVELNGSDTIKLSLGTAYTELGAKVTVTSGDIPELIISNNVDIYNIGTYIVTYSAEGLEEPVVRKVHVEDYKQVTLSIYGEAEIKASDANGDTLPLTCSRDATECTVLATDGEVIKIDVTPKGNYEFDGFSPNCLRTESTTSCTHEVMGNDLILINTTEDMAIELQSNIVFLSDEFISGIDALDEDTGTLILNGSVDVSGIEVGDVILSAGNSDGEYAFSRIVTKVISAEGAASVIETSKALITDIIKDGDVSFGELITPDESDDSSRAGKTSSDPFEELKKNMVRIESQFYSVGGLLSFTGTAGISVFTDDRLSIRDGEIQLASFVLYGLPDITGQMKVGIEKSGSTRLKFGSKRLGTKVIFLPNGFPLYFTFDAEAHLRIDHQAEASFDYQPSIKYSWKLASGMRYVKGHGWKRIKTTTAYKPQVNVNVDGNLTDYTISGDYSVGPELLVQGTLYGQLGLGMSVYGYSGERFTPINPPTKDCYFVKTPKSGAHLHAHSQLANIFGYKIRKYTPPLLTVTLPSGRPEDQCFPDQEAPTAPTFRDLVTKDSDTTIELSWSGATDNREVESYQIYRDNALYAKGIPHTESDDHTWTDSNVEFDTDYCYFIHSVDLSGNISKSPSNTKCVTTPDEVLPEAPSLTMSDVTTSSIKLTWNDSSVQGKYQYVIHKVEPSTGLKSGRASIDKKAVTITSLVESTEYCFVVTATDSNGRTSDDSNMVCGVTLAPESALWLMELACKGRSVNLKENVDINSNSSGVVTISGRGQDYNGDKLSYTVSAITNSDASSISGYIYWTFDNNSNIRKDRFSNVILSGGDSGRVTMEQVQVTGCDADIRFVKTNNKPPLQDIAKPSSLISSDIPTFGSF